MMPSKPFQLQIEEPFWELAWIPQLRNVYLDIKLVIDRRDSCKADEAFECSSSLRK